MTSTLQEVSTRELVKLTRHDKDGLWKAVASEMARRELDRNGKWVGPTAARIVWDLPDISRDARKLAAAFSAELRKELTPSDVAEAIARNRQEQAGVITAGIGSAGFCHSHDFCDANEVMWDAFRDAFGRDARIMGDDESDISLCSDAWSYAIESAFSVR